MGRPRKFDEAEALEQAMAVFWTNGYQRTTSQNLLDAMGLSRSSFYETFGSKRNLFLRCLDHYHHQSLEYLRQALAQDNIRVAIGSIYEQMIEMATTAECRWGCLAANTAAELAPHDPEIEQMLKAGLSQAQAVYCDRLQQAQEKGEIAAHHDARALAEYLMTCNAGFQIMAKAHPDPTALRRVMEVILSALE